LDAGIFVAMLPYYPRRSEATAARRSS